LTAGVHAILSNPFLSLKNLTFKKDEEARKLDNLFFVDTCFTLLLLAAIEKSEEQVQLERSPDEKWQR
jgi:hypothetical protein